MEKKDRWSEENYYFRIYSIGKNKVEIFRRIFPGLNFQVDQLRKRSNIRQKIQRFTIVIELNKNQKYFKYVPQIINFIKENKIPKTSYGLWISLSENRDHGGLNVPSYVKEFYSKIYSEIGGQLDFSYIFLEI